MHRKVEDNHITQALNISCPANSSAIVLRVLSTGCKSLWASCVSHKIISVLIEHS